MAVVRKKNLQGLLPVEPVRLANLILGLGLLYFIPWLLSYAWRVIQTPYPLEYREGSTLLMTDFFLRGQNPFSLANRPLLNNNYGFLYNLIVLPLAYFWGNTFLVHRTPALFFVLLSAALVLWTLAKNGVPYLFSLSGAGLVVGSMLYCTHAGARSESLGLLLFLTAVLIPWHRKFDRVSLLLSGGTGVLAFFAKPYFLLSIGIVAGYLFLFVAKKKGLLYLAGSFGVFGLLAWVSNALFPCYFLDVVINNFFNSQLSFEFMAFQLVMFVLAFSPCVVVLLSQGLVALKQGRPVEKIPLPDRRLDLFDLNRPVWTGAPDYFGFFGMGSLLALVLLLGRHMGTYLTYYLQLLTPALVLIVFRKPDPRQNTVVNAILFLVNLALVCFWVLFPNQLSAAEQKDWEKMARVVAASPQLLNSPPLVAEMVALGRLPVDSGQTEYFYSTRPYAGTLWAPPYPQVNEQGQKYLAAISASIQNRDYDRVILTQDYSPLVNLDLLQQNYQRVDVLTLAMPQTGQAWVTEIWEPKK